MKILNPKCNAFRKSRASLTGSIIIFMMAFLVFCICAIDVGYTVTSRYKTQKITETIALYMASYLNSLPETKKTKESLNPLKERFESLYSDYNIAGNYRFEITEIDAKVDSSSSVKIKIATQASIPTLFLRYVGIGVIKIIQTSYASTYQFSLDEIENDENSYTFKAKEIITDKNGNDLKISYNRPYLIFAGLKQGNYTGDDNIKWIEIGSMSDDAERTHFTISNIDKTYDAACISKENTKYDFSADNNKTLGLIQYIKIIKTDTCNVDGTIETPAALETNPVATALNSVKIISRQTFLKD